MVKSQIFGLLRSLSVFIKVTLSFFLVYLSFILFLIPLVFLLPYRLILSFVFLVFYKGKYKLVNSYDSIFAAWSSTGNVANITGFIYIDGPCDIEKLRGRLKENILQRDKNGHKPYGKLLNGFTEKFQLLCITDCSKTIDFNHHIRICPGMEGSSKFYSKNEFLDIAAKLVDDDYSELQPKWQIFLAPRVKSEETGKECSVLLVKVHHFYMDGISVIQFIRNCIADQPAGPLLFDPVNPPIPTVPFWYKTILTLWGWIVEPYAVLKTYWNTSDNFLHNQESGKKLYGRNSMKISRETMKRIRSFHGCSTEAVLHSAFLGSLIKIAMLKKIRISRQTIAAKVCAVFPYPNEFPINLAYFGCQLVKTELIQDPIKRLKEMNEFIISVNRRHYTLKSSLHIATIVGWYPLSVARFFTRLIKPSYYMSNVPGFQEQLKFHGNNIELLSGFPPLCNGMGYCGAVSYYGGCFYIGLLVHKSTLITNREDMDAWLLAFENEIQYLENVAYAKSQEEVTYCQKIYH